MDKKKAVNINTNTGQKNTQQHQQQQVSGNKGTYKNQDI